MELDYGPTAIEVKSGKSWKVPSIGKVAKCFPVDRRNMLEPLKNCSGILSSRVRICYRGHDMKIRNPFKKRMTAAETLQKIREIMEKYGYDEAYYKY